MNAEPRNYDPDNPFAKILRGEARAHIVHQDDHCMAFMDLMPQTPGHTLIIPRTPAAEIFELPADDLAQVITLTQRIAKAVRQVFEPPGVMIVQLNGALAGQTVFHLHFHVIPRFEGLDMKFHARVVEHPDVLDEHAERLSDALQHIR